MISQVLLNNVRVFDKVQAFELEALSLLCGINSSGKSTVLRSLLLLMQSFESLEYSADCRLVFSGEHADLGNYYSFVSHNDSSRDITIGLEILGTISPQFLPGHKPDPEAQVGPIAPQEYRLRVAYT